VVKDAVKVGQKNISFAKYSGYEALFAFDEGALG